MMDQMILLKALYEQQKLDSNAMPAVTSKAVDLSQDAFDSAVASLKEHGYVTDPLDGPVHVTKKGCLLAREL